MIRNIKKVFIVAENKDYYYLPSISCIRFE